MQSGHMSCRCHLCCLQPLCHPVHLNQVHPSKPAAMSTAVSAQPHNPTTYPNNVDMPYVNAPCSPFTTYKLPHPMVGHDAAHLLVLTADKLMPTELVWVVGSRLGSCSHQSTGPCLIQEPISTCRTTACLKTSVHAPCLFVWHVQKAQRGHPSKQFQ